jgi:hypothetical protein
MADLIMIFIIVTVCAAFSITPIGIILAIIGVYIAFNFIANR